MKTLKRYFVAGFFTLIPIGLSLAVVWWFVSLVDGSLAPVLDAALGWHLPGLGLAAALALILAVGALTSHVLGERLLEAAQEVLARIPVFKSVYGAIKQMTEAFSPTNKTSFKSVVVVEFPRPGVYSIGFVTSETSLDGKDLVCVYVPTNHVYVGDIVLVPREHVITTTLGVQAGIQIALSGGASLPATIHAQKGKRP
ncbi:MAG: DUF502 domain-containing protein [Elusimicrobiota bacterium]|nr:MAG: DUF502 domain-containing protein [Elusimicrobiota bacterium]